MILTEILTIFTGVKNEFFYNVAAWLQVWLDVAATVDLFCESRLISK